QRSFVRGQPIALNRALQIAFLRMPVIDETTMSVTTLMKGKQEHTGAEECYSHDKYSDRRREIAESAFTPTLLLRLKRPKFFKVLSKIIKQLPSAFHAA